MPTPPPLWMETQLAPAAVFNSAFSKRPIGYRVRAIFHALGFAKWRSHRSAVQMIASNHDGSLDRPFFHQIVNRQAEPRPLAISQPADASRQSLKLDALAGQFNPAPQAAILREKVQAPDRR
jgi:hypothetical protein